MHIQRMGSVLCFLFLLSCKSLPHAPEMDFYRSGFVPLDSGAVAVLFVDVPNARPILNDLPFINADDRQFQQMLDRTEFAAAAVYAAQAQRRYQLAAWGNYPASMARMAMGADRDWKKARSASGAQYWYEPNAGISIAVGSRLAQIAIAAANVQADPCYTAPGIAIPEGFNEFRQGAVLSCWIENPGPIINQWLGGMGLPIELSVEQMFINFFPVAEQYEATLQFQVSSEGQARSLANLFNFSRMFITPETLEGGPALIAAVFFANPPEHSGNKLIFTTNALKSSEMTLLFTLFSL